MATPYTAPDALQVRSLTDKGFRRAGIQFTPTLRLLLVTPEPSAENHITAAQAQAIEETPDMLVSVRLTREQALDILERQPIAAMSTEEVNAQLATKLDVLERRLMAFELAPGGAQTAATARRMQELSDEREEADQRARVAERGRAEDLAKFTAKLNALEARLPGATTAAVPSTPGGPVVTVPSASSGPAAAGDDDDHGKLTPPTTLPGPAAKGTAVVKPAK
jgi:hypothetical protein